MRHEGIEARIRILHVAVLAFWLGTVVMTGVAAAVIFPTMRELSVVVPDYLDYSGDHWLIAAGKVAFRIFGISDGIMVGCAVVALVTLAIETWPRVKGMRWAGLVLLVGCLAFSLMNLRPRMTRNLEAYWSNARAGHVEEAAKFKAAFDADHPRATWTMGVMAGLLLLNIGLATCGGKKGDGE